MMSDMLLNDAKRSLTLQYISVYILTVHKVYIIDIVNKFELQLFKINQNYTI